MTIDDDARDYRAHTRIENALRLLQGGRKLSRQAATAALLARARGAAFEDLEHMIEAILEGLQVTRSDLCDRIQAVIELDEEERQERAIADACNAEAEADA